MIGPPVRRRPLCSWQTLAPGWRLPHRLGHRCRNVRGAGIAYPKPQGPSYSLITRACPADDQRVLSRRAPTEASALFADGRACCGARLVGRWLGRDRSAIAPAAWRADAIACVPADCRSAMIRWQIGQALLRLRNVAEQHGGRPPISHPAETAPLLVLPVSLRRSRCTVPRHAMPTQRPQIRAGPLRLLQRPARGHFRRACLGVGLASRHWCRSRAGTVVGLPETVLTGTGGRPYSHSGHLDERLRPPIGARHEAQVQRWRRLRTDTTKTVRATGRPDRERLDGTPWRPARLSAQSRRPALPGP